MHSIWRDCAEWRNEGLAMSSASNEACKLFDAALTQYVGWYDDQSLGGLSGTCDKLIAADPNFVMAKVLTFGLDLLGTGRNIRLDEEFKKDYDTLITLAQSAPINGRESLHVKAIKQWADGLMPEAAQTWETILVEHPQDMLALKFAHDTYFYLGRSLEIRDSIARVISRWKPTSPLYNYLHGMYAFGLEEANMYERAEKHALKGLQLNPRDAWATHALAHVYEMTGQQDQGIRTMLKTETDWSSCGMLACHNYWHLALYYVDKGDYEAALTLFDNQVGERFKSGTLLDFVDASSLLYRLELEGVNVGSRWKTVIEMCKPHLGDHNLIFNDAHMMMATLGEGCMDSAETLLESLNEFIKSFPQNHQAKVARSVGYAICQAIIAYKNGAYYETVDLLYPIRYNIIEVGGSHAQRDVFNLLLINAALKSPVDGHKKLAKTLLVERKELKEQSPLTDRLIARALALH